MRTRSGKPDPKDCAADLKRKGSRKALLEKERRAVAVASSSEPARDKSPTGNVNSSRSTERRANGQWGKGTSGNSAGRRKGSRNKKAIIIEMMEAKLGRKIPDPNKMTRYEGMMFKALQKALAGDIRSMGLALTEYRKALESSGIAPSATTIEEDQQAYAALCAKIRREIEEEVRAEIRAELAKEAKIARIR